MKRPGVQLNTQQIRTFCDVFERGTYAAAARAAGLSTSAVWEQVKELEKQYALELFQRRGRQVEPTEAGVRLYEMLKPLLTGLDSTLQILGEGEGLQPSEITLAAGARMMIEEIGPGLAAFRQEYPDITLRVLQSSSVQVESLVVDGEVDLAMTLEPGPDHLSKAVTIEPAYEIDYLLLMPRNHELFERRQLRLADIIEYPLIVPQAGSYSRHVLDEAFHRQNLCERMKIAAETANSAFTTACVRSGVGIGIIAGRPRRRSLPRISPFVPCLVGWVAHELSSFGRAEHLIPPSVRHLADSIREAVQPTCSSSASERLRTDWLSSVCSCSGERAEDLETLRLRLKRLETLATGLSSRGLPPR
jgi:DNA-binding transcriptional LysR family regulator